MRPHQIYIEGDMSFLRGMLTPCYSPIAPNIVFTTISCNVLPSQSVQNGKMIRAGGSSRVESKA
jgi:hypothetical protein